MGGRGASFSHKKIQNLTSKLYARTSEHNKAAVKMQPKAYLRAKLREALSKRTAIKAAIKADPNNAFHRYSYASLSASAKLIEKELLRRRIKANGIKF